MTGEKVEIFDSILDLIWQRRYYQPPVIHFYKQSKCYESWTYAQLWLASQRIAKGLAHLPLETPILISLSNGPEFLATFFACQMNGLWPAPIVSPEIWNRDEYLDYISQISERTGIKNIVTTSVFEKELTQQKQNVLVFSELWKKNLAGEVLEKFALASSNQNIALLQFSSGSTSEAKGVLLTHTAILHNLSQIASGIDVNEKDSMATWLPLYHDMGLIGGFLAPLFHQLPVHISSPVDFVMNPLQWFSSVSEVKASVIVGPDFMYKLLARQGQQKGFSKDLSNLKICMTGSEPVMESTCQDFVEAFASANLHPHVIMPVYGMAEAVLGVTFSKPLNPRRTQQIQGTPTHWMSCGEPLSGIKIEIRDPEGKPLSDKVIGEIFISSPSLVVGFYKRPDLDSQLLHQGWLKTGDTGFLSANELFVTGRTKDVVIVRGRKIHTVDLETKIYKKWKDQISRIAVVSASESANNTSLVVAIEVRSWFRKNLKPDEFQAYLKSQWPDLDFKIFLLPKKSLPRTSSGKLKRYKIRELAVSGQLKTLAETSKLFSLRQNLVHFQLLIQLFKTRRGQKLNIKDQDFLKAEIEKIFSHYLNVKLPISFEKTFQEMGLDSIKMIELLSEFEKRFGEVPLEKFYQFKNLNDVHHFLKKENSIRKSMQPFASKNLSS